jgi:hypothetical protein
MSFAVSEALREDRTFKHRVHLAQGQYIRRGEA